MRRVDVGGADLGHAGRQVAEEAGPGVQVDAVARGQETGDLSRTLAEAGSVFAQEGRVHAHGSCKGTTRTMVIDGGGGSGATSIYPRYHNLNHHWNSLTRHLKPLQVPQVLHGHLQDVGLFQL